MFKFYVEDVIECVHMLWGVACVFTVDLHMGVEYVCFGEVSSCIIKIIYDVM